MLRSNFSNHELERLTQEIDLEAEATGQSSSASPIPDYFPGMLLGFGLSVEEAAAAGAYTRSNFSST